MLKISQLDNSQEDEDVIGEQEHQENLNTLRLYFQNQSPLFVDAAKLVAELNPEDIQRISDLEDLPSGAYGETRSNLPHTVFINKNRTESDIEREHSDKPRDLIEKWKIAIIGGIIVHESTHAEDIQNGTQPTESRAEGRENEFVQKAIEHLGLAVRGNPMQQAANYRGYIKAVGELL